jgi:hypothetical protein
MDFLSNLYQVGLDVATSLQHAQPITVSFVFAALIIAASIVITVRVPIREARILFVAVFAILTFVLSQGISGENNDFFFNLSTEFVGATVGLLLFADVLFDEIGGWLLLMTVAGFTLFAPVVLQHIALPFLSDQFILNLRTDLLGAFIVAVLLNRGWVIHSQLQRAHDSGKDQISKLEWLQEQKRINRERALEIKQMEAELKQRPPQLERRGQKLAPEVTAGQGGGQITSPQNTSPRQITITVEGQTQFITPVERTISEVFETVEQKVENPDSLTCRVYFTIDAPDKSFAQALQGRFMTLIEDWDVQSKKAKLQGEFAEPDDPQTLDYLYGVASGYQLAIDDLKSLIASMEEE